ncbi:IclR family transcriptional regulator [Thalassotalea agarivorans]|nr:helix-turn-helix domain-containing protein [Thalassotalea agarivorans]
MRELLEKPIKYAVPALDKALEIIEFLAIQTKGLTQAEIAQGLARSPNEIYRILVNLETRGYLIRDEKNSRYKLSLKLYNLSHSVSPIAQIRQVALPQMEDLAVKLGVSCYLSILYQSQTMVLISANSYSPVALSVNEGSLFSASQSSAGLVLLAHSNEQVKAMILERDKPYQLLKEKAKTELHQTLATIADNGFIMADNTLVDGIFDISCIVGEIEGKIIAALTIPCLKHVTGKTIEQTALLEELQLTASNIKQQLGN